MHFLDIIVDRMYSIVEFNIWLLEALSIVLPKKGILIRIGSVFLTVFDQCLLECSDELVFQLQTWKCTVRKKKLLRHHPLCIRSYSCPHFPAFGLNAERYGVSLHILCKCGKMPTRITPNTDKFYAVTTIVTNWI